MKKQIILILVILLLYSIGFAQRANFNYSRMMYGHSYSSSSARSLALAGTGLAAGASTEAGLFNPALAALNKSSIAASAGLSFDRIEEDRSYPYYDTFAGFVDYGSYLFTKNWYPNAYGSLLFQLPVSFIDDLNIGIAYLPFNNFVYDYYEEVGNPNRTPEYKKDKILGYNTIQQNGRLDIIPLTIGMSLIQDLSIGLQVGILTGDIDSTSSINPRDEMFTSEEIIQIKNYEQRKKTLENSPIVTALGIRYQFDDFFTAAALLRLPYTVKFNSRYSSEQNPSLDMEYLQELKYPMLIGVGVDYRFTNILAARLSFDLIYEQWSQFEDNRKNDLLFEDTYSIRTGIEHIFWDKVPFRIGFQYNTMRESSDFAQSIISLGTGIVVSNLNIDFSVAISSFEYYQNDLFDDSIYGQLSRGKELDRVSINKLWIKLGFRYVFNFKQE